MNRIFLIALLLLLAGCQSADETSTATTDDHVAAIDAEAITDNVSADQFESPIPVLAAPQQGTGLAAVLAAQSNEAKARYRYRNPRETVDFFGIVPGMTVVEGLPGGGWYSRILLPYLGEEGHLIGSNYALDMWPNFSFASEEFMAETSQWLANWPQQASEWSAGNAPQVSGFWFGSLPDEMHGVADVVFFPRVLHNLARFQAQGIDNYLDEALADVYAVLKPGGVFGIVQHMARDAMPDEWADGSNGYLKKQFVIEQVEKAGFELVAESGINHNHADQPTAEDIVWRLPPSLATSRNNAEQRAEYEAVGESHRMTLKFRKPK